MRYFSIVGAGKIKEVTEGEYEFVLRKAARPESHEELMKPGHGINYMGGAWFVLEDKALPQSFPWE